MLERFRQYWTTLWSPVARLLIRAGVTPNMVTTVGTLGVVAGAVIFFPRGQLLTGVLVITAFVFADLLDGHIARTTGTVSSFGGFLDSTLDRIGDAAIFGSLAMYFAAGHYPGPGDSRVFAGLAIYCLAMGATTSYARAKAESLGMRANVGIAERADRLVSVLVITGLAALVHQLGADENVLVAVPAILTVLAVASTVTVIQRILVVRRQALELDARTAAGAEPGDQSSDSPHA